MWSYLRPLLAEIWLSYSTDLSAFKSQGLTRAIITFFFIFLQACCPSPQRLLHTTTAVTCDLYHGYLVQLMGSPAQTSLLLQSKADKYYKLSYNTLEAFGGQRLPSVLDASRLLCWDCKIKAITRLQIRFYVQVLQCTFTSPGDHFEGDKGLGAEHFLICCWKNAFKQKRSQGIEITPQKWKPRHQCTESVI